MNRLPPLRSLQALEAFGRFSSVTQAAKELGVTPGAVSQQIRKVEEAVGLSLVHRNGMNVSLTPLGRRYCLQLTKAFNELHSAQEMLNQVRAENVLVVSCLPSLAAKWLGPWLIDWQAKHREVEVRLVASTFEPDWEDGNIDFRISYGARARSSQHYVDLFQDQAVPACSPEFLSGRNLKTPGDILAGPLLGIEWDAHFPSPPSWPDWAASCGEPVPPVIAMRFSISSAAIDAAINSRGLVLAQMAMIESDLKSGRLVVPVDDRVKLSESYFLAWGPGTVQKAYAAEFRSWILQLSKRQGKTAIAPLEPKTPA